LDLELDLDLNWIGMDWIGFEVWEMDWRYGMWIWNGFGFGMDLDWRYGK